MFFFFFFCRDLNLCPQSGFIMASVLSTVPREWSQCTKDYVYKMFNRNNPACINEEGVLPFPFSLFFFKEGLELIEQPHQKKTSMNVPEWRQKRRKTLVFHNSAMCGGVTRIESDLCVWFLWCVVFAVPDRGSQDVDMCGDGLLGASEECDCGKSNCGTLTLLFHMLLFCFGFVLVLILFWFCFV